MFSTNKCLVHYCNNMALSTVNEKGEIENQKSYCLDHSPNPGKSKEDIVKYIHEHDTIVGLNANGLLLQNSDLSNKKFYGCSFIHCTFSNIRSQNLLLKMCIFDFAVMNDCNLLNSKIVYTSFSGGTFTHCLFTSSDMIQDNFNGIKAYQSSFDDSDLFNSRFINATLVDTSYRNCNLKKTLFYDTKRTNVSFKMSNTREAAFTRDGSNLILGTEADAEELANSETVQEEQK